MHEEIFLGIVNPLLILGDAHSTIQRYEKKGNLKGKAKSGRPSVLTRALKAKIIWLMCHHPNYTAVYIAKELNNVVSHDTITRYLKTLNFSWKNASKIPMLSEEDREARINFAKIKRSYDFSNTIFTDETTFFLDYSLNVWEKKESVYHFLRSPILKKCKFGRPSMN